MRTVDALLRRRQVVRRLIAVSVLLAGPRLSRSQTAAAALDTPHKRWYEAAAAMKRLAESWGDQSYGAVLVLNNQLVGEGPSRVVKLADSNAHAEREAIRDAQRRLKQTHIAGSVLYSTSRPCPACEEAAAAAGVSRMYFGEGLQDGGVPKPCPLRAPPGRRHTSSANDETSLAFGPSKSAQADLEPRPSAPRGGESTRERPFVDSRAASECPR